MEKKKDNWFEKNPKKTWALLSLAFVFFCIASLFILEFIAEFDLMKDTKEMNSNLRAIRLREYRPSENAIVSGIDQEKNKLIPKSNPLRTDNDGFILPAKIHDNPDVTIFFIGGSTTACTWVDEEKRFPFLTGRLIESKTNLKVNSYNSGRDANHSMHSLNILINKIIPYKPDIVVLMNNINDIVTLMYTQSYWNDAPTRSMIYHQIEVEHNLIRKQLFEHHNNLFRNLFPNLYEKCFYYYLRISDKSVPRFDEWLTVRGKKVTIKVEDIKYQFENSVKSFITICKEWDIKPVLMTQAGSWHEQTDSTIMENVFEMIITEEMPTDNPRLQTLHTFFNEIIRNIARDRNVHLIDIDRLVPINKGYMYDVLHYNNEGSVFISNIISENLINVIKKDSIKMN